VSHSGRTYRVFDVRPGVRGLLVALASVSLVTGCAANFGAQTNQQYQPAEGTSVREGDIYALNALVVAPDSPEGEEGEGTEETEDGGSASYGTVVVALVNQSTNQDDADDSLQMFSATTSSGDELEAAPLPEAIVLPSGVSVQTADDGALRLSGPGIEPGALITLRFQFEVAAPIEVEVPVVAQGTTYADVPVGPAEPLE